MEPLPTKCFFAEINLWNKRFVCYSYNPRKNNISNQLQTISKLDLYSSNYESITLVGDFNSEINDECINDFCESYNLSSLIRSCILWGFLTHFSSQARKNKKIHTQKNSFYFRKWNFLALILKKFRKQTPPKKFIIFQEGETPKKLLIFQET